MDNPPSKKTNDSVDEARSPAAPDATDASKNANERHELETIRKIPIEKRLIGMASTPRQRVGTIKGLPDGPKPKPPPPKPSAPKPPVPKSSADSTGKTKAWSPSVGDLPKMRGPSKTLIGVAPPAPRV